MKEIELCFYERLDNEIYDRAYDLCSKLNLLYKSSMDVYCGNGKVIMNIIDYEGDVVDSLIMTYAQFSSSNHINIAKDIREEEQRKIEESKRKAEAEAKERELQGRKELYEKLKLEFEGES